MRKINKVLNFKLVSLIIACIFLLSNIAYGIDLSEKTSLRKPLDFNNPNITSRYLDVLPAQTDSYEKFQDWLGNISQSKLENTLIFLDVLETLVNSLSDKGWGWYVQKAYSEALKALIDAGMVTKEEAKEKNILEILVNSLSDSGWSWYVQKANSEALKALIDAGLVTKEEAKEKNVLEILVKGLRYSGWGWYVQKANSEALKALIDAGLATKEEAIKEVKEKNTLESLVNNLRYSGWGVQKVISETLRVLIDAGIVTKEEAIKEVKEKNVLEILVKGLSDSSWDVRKAISETLRVLIDTGIFTKEEVIREAKKQNVLEILVKGPSDSDEEVQKTDSEKPLKTLIKAGIFTRKEAKEKNLLLEILVKGLRDPDEEVQKTNSEALKALIDAGLVTKEEEFSREEIERMLVEVYGRGIPVPGYFHYYLKFLGILRDDPIAAYQVFNWSPEELLELFRICDYFVKGSALDPRYKAGGGDRYFLEKELIKNRLDLIKKPQALLNDLRQGIKTTISDDSVKLAIRLHEMASVNAARGLIKTLGLDKDNVIILYDTEIDSEQAGKFFPGYNIRASGLIEKNSIKIEFHDYGNMRIESLDRFISIALPYTPFKFNLPERLSEKEIGNMRESLGIGSRKVIVLGSPSDREFDEFMQVYNLLYGALPYGKRPLIISGFRQRRGRRSENELISFGGLSGQSIAIRNDDEAPLPNVKNNNVLILNTFGELLRMYALADVAIVGEDRNIFEPASQEAAVLYFEGRWRNNREAKEALVKTRAAQVFSALNLKRLMASRHESEEMAKKGLEAFSMYKKEVQSKTEELALQIIGIKAQLRDKFIAGSPVEQLIALKEDENTPLASGHTIEAIKDVIREAGIADDTAEFYRLLDETKGRIRPGNIDIKEAFELTKENQYYDEDFRDFVRGWVFIEALLYRNFKTRQERKEAAAIIMKHAIQGKYPKEIVVNVLVLANNARELELIFRDIIPKLLTASKVDRIGYGKIRGAYFLTLRYGGFRAFETYVPAWGDTGSANEEIPAHYKLTIEPLAILSNFKVTPALFIDTEVAANPDAFREALAQLRQNEGNIPVVLLTKETKESIITKLRGIDLKGVQFRTRAELGLQDLQWDKDERITLIDGIEDLKCIPLTKPLCETYRDLQKARDQV